MVEIIFLFELKPEDFQDKKLLPVHSETLRHLLPKILTNIDSQFHRKLHSKEGILLIIYHDVELQIWNIRQRYANRHNVKKEELSR